MKFYKKHTKNIEEYEITTIEHFAWRPITIKGETRWLERVKQLAYYWVAPISNKCHWERKKFIDD